MIQKRYVRQKIPPHKDNRFCPDGVGFIYQDINETDDI